MILHFLSSFLPTSETSPYQSAHDFQVLSYFALPMADAGSLVGNSLFHGLKGVWGYALGRLAILCVDVAKTWTHTTSPPHASECATDMEL